MISLLPLRRSRAIRLTRTKWPRWLVPNCVSNPSAVWPKGVAITPALATTTSMNCPFASSSSAHARTLLRLARSSATSSKLPPAVAAALLTCAVAASAFFKSRAAPTTCPACATSDRAVSMPRPAETPVTRIRLPCRFMPYRTSSVVEVAPNTSRRFIIFFLLRAARPDGAQRSLLTSRRSSHKTESVSATHMITGGYLRLQVFFIMPKKHQKPVQRKPRADAQRNRERILDVAKEAFARHGANASLDDIAKQVGVGPGTLYRHFPTRAELLQAVYRAELEKLAAAEQKFTQTMAPTDALRAWLLLFVDTIAAKQLIAPALNTLLGDPKKVFEASYAKMHQAIRALVKRGVESGEIRSDLDPVDLLRALIGVSNVASAPDWQPSARRLVDILIVGSRPVK